MKEKLIILMISSLRSAYFWLCTLLCKIELNIPKKITREHIELPDIKSLFKVNNTSVNSVVFLDVFFGVRETALANKSLRI